MSQRSSVIDETEKAHIALTERAEAEELAVPLFSKPRFDSKTIAKYFRTRVTELVPDKENVKASRHLLNPFPALKEIHGRQWLLMLSGFLCWTWDAFDYFSVSLNASSLADDFNVDTTAITWGLTLVLMFRTIGALVFGYLGDSYGRKWPLVINMCLMCILEIGTGFITTYKQFLACRALFGIIMGGIFGNAAATVLDDCPPRARGIVSGFFQQGYALGYLLAVVFTRAIANNTAKTWRALFWFAAGCCSLIIVSRASLPETRAFQDKIALDRYRKEHNIIVPTFKEKAMTSLRVYWLVLIYMVLLMSGFNFMSHGSQDLFPTLLSKQLLFSTDRSTVTNCVANLGALTGGILCGHFSNFTGRRLAIMVCCVFGGAMIYPWAFTTGSGINAGVFFLQFFVQGAWGVVPVHLSELSPPEFRAIITGTAYQLGNLASSASSTIESTIGETFPIQNADGTTIYDYAKVMAIFMGCVFAYVLIVTFVGPENSAISRRNHNVHEEHLHHQHEAAAAAAVDVDGEHGPSTVSTSEITQQGNSTNVQEVESNDSISKTKAQHVEV